MIGRSGIIGGNSYTITGETKEICILRIYRKHWVEEHRDVSFEWAVKYIDTLNSASPSRGDEHESNLQLSIDF